MPFAFWALKVLGGLYLCYIAYKTLRDARLRECKKICVSGILNNLLKGNWNANYRSNPRSASC